MTTRTRTTCGIRHQATKRRGPFRALEIAASIGLFFLLAGAAQGLELRVMKTGLGSGVVTSDVAGIDCGVDCRHHYSSFQTVRLTVVPDFDSEFAGWQGDCAGDETELSCDLTMDEYRSVRAEFRLKAPILPLTEFTPESIDAFVRGDGRIHSAARFISALPAEFKQNWILMTRSESLQTGTATHPRILMPSADATVVFSISTALDSSYPGSHPNAIEFMQWDAAEKNFRFHEIVLAPIAAMGTFEERSTRGVSPDDLRCSKCHSTQNVINRSSHPGTSGMPAGSVKVKNKPNWDPYDSWAGMLPFNRDRIYKGSLEAAAFRRLLNPWTWETEPDTRAVIEQLQLQPPGVQPDDVITRVSGGVLDGAPAFAFDDGPVSIEPVPMGDAIEVSNYRFPGTSEPPTWVVRGGDFVTLRHSTGTAATTPDGRGVRFHDLLVAGTAMMNPRRIGDELANHRFATGSVPVEIRPTALAIAKQCLVVDTAANRAKPDPEKVTSVLLTVPHSFFDARHGMRIRDVLHDTRMRAQSVPRRKADLQRLNLDRQSNPDPVLDPDSVPDPYLVDPSPTGGLIQEFGAYTDLSLGTSTEYARIRREVFRRPLDEDSLPSVDMGGLFPDQERYYDTTEPMALFRYFLEPLGVSVDKWSMAVRGRSRTYAMADVYEEIYREELVDILVASLDERPVPGLSAPYACTDLVTAMNNTLTTARLPRADAPPTFTDVQRIFNKSCIECHGGLSYPPYSSGSLDLSENETPPTGESRFTRSYEMAVERTSSTEGILFRKIIDSSEDCPGGMMPCGGPALSQTDIETIRRWIVGGHSSSTGDPHIRTIDGIHYDFQAAGEFVLLRDEGMELQARQTAVPSALPLGPDAHTGLSSCVSINSAVAVRMGRHRITYQPRLDGDPDPEGLELRIDGELIPAEVTVRHLRFGGRILRDASNGVLQIQHRGTVVVVTPVWWSHHGVWFMNIDVRGTRATRGLMGAAAPGSWLPTLPDGSQLGARPTALAERYDQLYGELGNAWRVTDDESLFDYGPGIDTHAFTLEEWPLGESPDTCAIPHFVWGTPETEAQEPIAEEVAATLCTEVVDKDRRTHCTMDVSATGEPAFADAYLQAEVLTLNKPPAVPELLSPPESEVTAQPVQLVWQPGEEDQQTRYHLCVWAEPERFTFDACVEVEDTASIWPEIVYEQGGDDLDPQSGDLYFWKVLAEDELGAVTESETWTFELE